MKFIIRKKIRSMLLLILLISLIGNTTACNSSENKDSFNESNSNSNEESTDSNHTENKNNDTINNTDDEDTKQTIALTMNKENYPKVDGSTATIPLSAAVYRYATGATKEEADANIVHTKTTNSYLSLINGEVDLLIVYEPSQTVYETLETTSVKLNMKPIGLDAFVFLANESNPVTSLTQEEIIQIYSGKITNWSKVGGNDKEIIAFQRPDDSGSQTLMKKLVMKDIDMIEAPSTMKPTGMDEIITAIAEYNNNSNALGYSVFYYTQNMYNQPGLRYMPVNGIEPTSETIQEGEYPYINEFYAVIREDEPAASNAHKIFDWLTSTEGKTLIQELGYIPVK